VLVLFLLLPKLLVPLPFVADEEEAGDGDDVVVELNTNF